MLYPGKQDRPDYEILRLSDAFVNSDNDGSYERTATVLNVNTGHKPELLETCKVLKEYSSDVMRQDTRRTDAEIIHIL